nr:MAG TPA: hypothetical protein [Herelleviridae sp.]
MKSQRKSCCTVQNSISATFGRLCGILRNACSR